MGVRSLRREDPLEKETAAHARILAWEIPWAEEAAGYSPRGCLTVRRDLATKQQRPPPHRQLFTRRPAPGGHTMFTECTKRRMNGRMSGCFQENALSVSPDCDI